MLIRPIGILDGRFYIRENTEIGKLPGNTVHLQHRDGLALFDCVDIPQYKRRTSAIKAGDNHLADKLAGALIDAVSQVYGFGLRTGRGSITESSFRKTVRIVVFENPVSIGSHIDFRIRLALNGSQLIANRLDIQPVVAFDV